MWTRAELKARAKANLSRYYGPALLVSFLATLFDSSGGSSNSGNAAAGVNTGVNISQEYNFDVPIEGGETVGDVIAGLPDSLGSVFDAVDPVALSVMASVLVVALVIGFVISVFVAPLFKIGKNRFYMESRQTGYSVGVQEILWGFTHDYLNIVWVMFLRGLIIMLGSMLCFIPGIYFGYCYYMVPYILAENPDMKATDALRMSKEMMEGQKFNTFVLEISFWGWWILGSMLCGVGAILVQPYYDATFAELYAVLRQRFQHNLNGFGHPDIGPNMGPSAGPGGYYDPNGSYYQGGNSQNDYHDYTTYHDNYYENTSPPSATQDRGGEVKRSEGGPGRGYYLNGVFYPYTEDELRELENNKK